MTRSTGESETAIPEGRIELPDRAGDVRVAVTPRQMAFLALIAGVILVGLRRLSGRGRGKNTTPDAEG